ncbi:MAG TPA: DUF5605 domain-containing protein [Anaerolineae bacterium]|nr:DUF5605 domain-containing protein [Anaerolineae bacterium]HQI84014.1 DUF5605 domain-containing protein [Anaerolineae bacterium]
MQQSVERWDIFEAALAGPAEGNPFLDVTFGARFAYKHRVIDVDGFYDGDGCYKVRFMPDTVGAWTYTTRSNVAALDGQTGTFKCTPASAGNHGPVRVRNMYHFAYEDGTPHFSVGTTCYVWNHQGDALEEQTLETLKTAPFNKLRMCVFPKHYTFNQNEPPYHAFEKNADGTWDFARFNPAFFRHLEQRVGNLRDLGIEADIILFHPYDRWGYSTMPAEVDDRYLRYVVARLAAYRNVWWSMANEFDLMQAKTEQDWERFFQIVQESDPYQHLRSVHNCRYFYDHNKPWVTHCSIQRSELNQVNQWRELYKKPVVVDECCYEGDIWHNWGNITAQEMVHRFWEGFSRGGYVGHGETYLHPDDILWWSKGGVLHGESPARIAFLREIMEAGPAIDPRGGHWDLNQSTNADDSYRLIYLGINRPACKDIALPEDAAYTIEVIDTWEMTITPLEGTFSGKCRVPLPAKQYIALRIKRCA